MIKLTQQEPQQIPEHPSDWPPHSVREVGQRWKTRKRNNWVIWESCTDTSNNNLYVREEEVMILEDLSLM